MLEYAGNIFFLNVYNNNNISSGQKSNKIVLNNEKKKLDSDFVGIFLYWIKESSVEKWHRMIQVLIQATIAFV